MSSVIEPQVRLARDASAKAAPAADSALGYPAEMNAERSVMTLRSTVTPSSQHRRDLGQCLPAGFVNSLHAEDESSGGGENSRMVAIKQKAGEVCDSRSQFPPHSQ